MIPVSVMVFTLNEEVNLPACLASLKRFEDVIVVDSFSDDRTEEIARAGGARFFQHRFEGFGSQRNWAFDNTAPRHRWVLVLDADERATPELADEIGAVVGRGGGAFAAFRLKRRLMLWGTWLRHSSLYPTWVVRLVDIDRVRYLDRGHAETQEVDGAVGELHHDLIDENLKGLGEWFNRQNRYAEKEADHELRQEPHGSTFASLFSRDPLRRREALKAAGRGLPGRPLWFFLYMYLMRGGWRDGKAGYHFCLMKTAYQIMIDAHKYSARRDRER